MQKKQLAPAPINDPYAYMEIKMLQDSFHTIYCYLSHKGTKDEIAEGKKALRWIKRMDRSFRLMAMACDWSVERLHQLCLWKVNQIKQQILKEQNEITTVVR